MDFEKLTDRARGFLQAAQTIAVREHHQRIAPAHLLKALLDDDQGMAAGLIEAAGGDAKAARREADALVAKVPLSTMLLNAGRVAFIAPVLVPSPSCSVPALMTVPPNISATASASADFPLAVGPAMTSTGSRVPVSAMVSVMGPR